MLTPKERYSRWRAKHLEQARAKNRAYHYANKAKRIEYLKKRQPIIRERYRKDPKFRLQFVLRQRIRQSFKRSKIACLHASQLPTSKRSCQSFPMATYHYLANSTRGFLGSRPITAPITISNTFNRIFLAHPKPY